MEVFLDAGHTRLSIGRWAVEVRQGRSVVARIRGEVRVGYALEVGGRELAVDGAGRCPLRWGTRRICLYEPLRRRPTWLLGAVQCPLQRHAALGLLEISGLANRGDCAALEFARLLMGDAHSWAVYRRSRPPPPPRYGRAECDYFYYYRVSRGLRDVDPDMAREARGLAEELRPPWRYMFGVAPWREAVDEVLKGPTCHSASWAPVYGLATPLRLAAGLCSERRWLVYGLVLSLEPHVMGGGVSVEPSVVGRLGWMIVRLFGGLFVMFRSLGAVHVASSLNPMTWGPRLAYRGGVAVVGDGWASLGDGLFFTANRSVVRGGSGIVKTSDFEDSRTLDVRTAATLVEAFGYYSLKYR